MDMAGERLISAPQNTVWSALNDPEILKACIPGCESLEATSESEMTAVAAVKLGPISAKFSGRVRLSDIDPPNGYTLSGEGKGGPAGFAKGAAKVRLTPVPEGTRLTYTVEAQVGGRIAQLGARLIDATAKSMADQFFTKFSEQVQALVPKSATATVPRQRAAEVKANANATSWLLVGMALVVVIAAALFLMQ
jgi:carbon monoxide dehydrogenase subunit G